MGINLPSGLGIKGDKEREREREREGGGWGCSSVGRSSDRHAADAGSIPRYGKEFSPRVNFQCRLSYGVRKATCKSHAYIPVRTLKIP